MSDKKKDSTINLTLLLQLGIPLVALISSISILIYKVDAIATTTDKTCETVDSIDTRMTIVETVLSIQETPRKRQGVSK